MTNSLHARPAVIISSRLDELGSSRRAAFRAVHDEAWNPLLYETEPGEWLAAERRLPNKKEHARREAKRQSANTELTINALLKADYFIGIYGTSLGDPSPQFCGLRPLEYEFLRFLMTHVWREQHRSVDTLEQIFQPSDSPDDIDKARGELEKALEEVKIRSSLYYKVFWERMVLFLKQSRSDVPASSLMYSTILRLHRSVCRSRVKFFRSGVTRSNTDVVVYWRPSSHLYLNIRSQIQRWRKDEEKRSRKRKVVRRPRRRRAVRLLIGTSEEIGFVLNVAKMIFYKGYTVKELSLGLGEKGKKDRRMYITAAPYLYARKDLRTSLKKKLPYVETTRTPFPTLAPLPSRGQRWTLKIIVADRPGMLARALAPLVHFDMQALKITVGEINKSTSVKGPFNLIEITFAKSKLRQREGEVIERGFRLPKKPQFALDCIASDLTSQPGFYSVDLSEYSGDEATKSGD
jgi:hypothetical protein